MLQFAMALGALTAMLTLASAQTDTDGRVEITFQKAGRSGGSGYLFYQGQKYGLAIAGPEIKRIWATSIDVAYPHLADASRAAAELVLSGRASHVPDDATTVAPRGCGYGRLFLAASQINFYLQRDTGDETQFNSYKMQFIPCMKQSLQLLFVLTQIGMTPRCLIKVRSHHGALIHTLSLRLFPIEGSRGKPTRLFPGAAGTVLAAPPAPLI
jgi:hypothetical protein